MTTVEETTHADTMPPGPSETNGHALKRKSRSVMRREAVQRDEPAPTFDALMNAKAFLATQRSTVDAKKKLAAALREEIQERAALLVQLEGTPINHFPVRAPREKAKPLSKPRQFETSAPAKSSRKPRENSVPQRVLGAIERGLTTAAEIAAHEGLEPKLVHSGLHQLMKSGKVKSKGTRKSRVWSVK